MYTALLLLPTGCGKTEIARRLAKLCRAPFVKVEATKFTEVGYHGRDGTLCDGGCENNRTCADDAPSRTRTCCVMYSLAHSTLCCDVWCLCCHATLCKHHLTRIHVVDPSS